MGIITMLNGINYLLPLTSQTTQDRKREGKSKRSAMITTFIRNSAGIEIANISNNNSFLIKTCCDFKRMEEHYLKFKK